MRRADVSLLPGVGGRSGARLRLACVAVVVVALLGCTSGDTDAETGSGKGSKEPSATGPAPGVTDDTVKIGVTYVDTAPLVAVGLDYDLGDHKAVYQALADHINESGGVEGREIELVLTPVDATSSTPGEAQCVELTEDEDVFLVTGFFLGDSVLCPLEAHATAVVGGNMSPKRLERAQAPWLSWLPDADQPEAVVQAFADGGELDRNVAVFASTEGTEQMEDVVLPALEEAGIEPVATGIMDAPPDDVTAEQASVRLIAERFEAADADTVVFVGASGANWLKVMADDPGYRPELRFLDLSGPGAFATSEATADTSILEGSVSGGNYGPSQRRFEEPEMQRCLAILEEAGIETPAPDDLDPDDASTQPYQAAFQACPDMALVRAWLEAAGKDLNYGTLAGAIDGLEIVVPGDPTRRTYGDGSLGDGDPEVYFFRWEESAGEFALDEG